ncbi:MAG: N utilization substance protein B-like protein [Candidatus Saccharibacteria bacterium GW2011_GWC2_48_9]|nr:MAG: N utilization substance protein B-like protein [Candidatus Saccharibacteria bacterium GW2011_GWC2_48_9]HCH34225.1 transcription antitermination factor NusB [Candidatus Saccharibacteria bacterium]
MASNRHLGRIVALQSLYEYEFRHTPDAPVDIDVVIARNMDRYKDDIGDAAFVGELARGVIDSVEKLDEVLQPLAPDWPLAQVARIDRNILRIGLYELLYRQEDVPARVAINEAVELAKSFGSDNSSKFINGVLGTAYRTLVEDQTDGNTSEV